MELPLPEEVDHTRERLVFGVDVTFQELRTYYDEHWHEFFLSLQPVFMKEAEAVQLLGLRVGYTRLIVYTGVLTAASERNGTSNFQKNPDLPVLLVSLATNQPNDYDARPTEAQRQSIEEILGRQATWWYDDKYY
jgi:hypothetical protein